MSFRDGDRVRIKNPHSEYTGCRGTIVIQSGDQPPGMSVLGHFVAIDGENGRVRPFVISDLERLTGARIRGAAEIGSSRGEAEERSRPGRD